MNHYKNFHKAAVERFTFPHSPEIGSLAYWRARILFSILFAAMLFVTFASITGIATAVEQGAWGLIIFNLFGDTICVFLIFSRRLKYTTRASVTLMMCYATGIAVILSVGPLSGGAVWLFAFAVLVGILLGARPAVFAILLNAGSLSIIAWLMAAGKYGADFPFFQTPQIMVSAIVNFVVMNAIVAVSVASLVKGLVVTSENKGALAESLKQEQVQLVRAKEELEIEITERKQAQKDLGESKEKYRRFIENAPMAVYTINTEGAFTYGNKKLLEITGYRMEEWLNKPFHPIVHPDDLELVVDKVYKRISGQGNPDPYEIRIFHSSGDIMWVEIVSESIFEKSESGANKLVGMQSFMTDITGRKKAEKERTRLEKELHQSRKMESLGTLTGGIAHDFNNILYIMIGNVDLALGDVPQWSPLHANLEAIKTAGLRAAGIVKQLLNFSQPSEQDLKPVEIIAVFRDAVSFLRSTIPTTIEIRQQLPDSEITILADPVQINQLLMNVCNNASQAMEQTGGRLDINVQRILKSTDEMKAFPDLPAGDYLRLTIGDTGPGIDSKIIDRIFDPYFTTKEFGKGVGMGLTVVHGIVGNHGGFIAVDNQPGSGAVFTILFPIVADQHPSLLETADDIPLGNETVLFVDDDEVIAEMTQQILERLGYEVKTTTNPSEALALFEAHPDDFDLVITDMTMPQMTGVGFYERLKQVRDEIPVIVCTGYSSLIDEEKARQMGIAALVMKPIIISEIARTVRTVLDEAKDASE